VYIPQYVDDVFQRRYPAFPCASLNGAEYANWRPERFRSYPNKLVEITDALDRTPKDNEGDVYVCVNRFSILCLTHKILRSASLGDTMCNISDRTFNPFLRELSGAERTHDLA